MKLYSKILGLTCALMIASASSALAVTYVDNTGGHSGEQHFTGDSYTGPEAFFTEADRLPHRTTDQAQRVSVMIKRVGNDVTNDAIKATNSNQERTWFTSTSDAASSEEILYINEAAPEVDTELWQASDAFENTSATRTVVEGSETGLGTMYGGMRVKENLAPGRYAMFIGTSHDLEHSEDNQTGLYVEYFNVYEDGSTKAIGMQWKDKKTGSEMRSMQASYISQPDSNITLCPAKDTDLTADYIAENNLDTNKYKAYDGNTEYHVAYIADLYGKEADDSYGMIFSYTEGSTNKCLQVVCPLDQLKDIEIHGGAALRVGIEICKIPAAYIDTFKAEGFIIPNGAAAAATE